MKNKYEYKEFWKHNKDFKFIITENGHTMMASDIVMGLDQKEMLLRKIDELEKQNKELIEMYIELFKEAINELMANPSNKGKRPFYYFADEVNFLQEIKQKPIEEILKEVD